jgi:phage replication-related protein YjqB (UPF0714/DUF867 family)
MNTELIQLIKLNSNRRSQLVSANFDHKIKQLLAEQSRLTGKSKEQIINEVIKELSIELSIQVSIIRMGLN